MNTKEKLMQLLELCIEKGLQFEYSPKSRIAVKLQNKGFNNDEFWVFYHDVWNFEEEINQSKIDDLITKVKNYQP